MDREELKQFLTERWLDTPERWHGRKDLPIARASSAYLPFLYRLLTPLTALPYRTAAGVWFFLNQCLLFGSLFLAVRMMGKGIGREGKFLLFILTFSFFPILFSLKLGQINMVTLFFLTLTLFFSQRGRPFLSGLALGGAAVVKLIPALLVFYFLWKRHWKVALTASSVLLVGYAVSIWDVGLPFIVTQFEVNQEYSRIHFTDWGNNSVASFWFMLLTRGRGEEGYAQGLVHQPLLAAGLYLVTALLLIGISLWTTRPDERKESKQTLLEFCLWVTLLPILSPWTNVMFLALLILPFWVAFLHLNASGRMTFFLILSFILTGLRYWPDGFHPFRQGLGVIFLLPKLYGALLLWVLLVCKISEWRKGREIG